MKKKYRFSILYIHLILVSIVYTLSGQEIELSTTTKKWNSSILNQNDSISKRYAVEYKKYVKEKDTLSQIKILNKLGDLYCNRIDYEKSYDSYWKALLLAEKNNNKSETANSYNGIAILYSLYDRRNEALKYYLKSLNINKELVSENKLDSSVLANNYLPLATHYFYDNDITNTKKYIDSCQKVIVPHSSNYKYLEVQKGFLLLLKSNYAEAEKQLLPLEAVFKKEKPSYLVVYYAMLGDIYRGLKKSEKAIKFYNKSNNIAYKYNNHLNFLPDTYEKLSLIYQDTNNELESLKNLLTAQQINQYLYSSRSNKNKYLLEIKDQFLQEKERIAKLSAIQKLKELKHKESLWKLRSIIILISILFLAVLGLIIYRSLITKHRNEKRILLEKKKLEEQKSKEILDIKNKELTESTLRLMAKDELLNNIKSDLKEIQEKPSLQSTKKLIKSISINSKENWSEFESRFTMVNEGFYERLKQKYPNLNPYDLKISALVKLEFSGKEMAKVMGISYESANTARYRLRKKLALNKEENLVSFMKSI